MTVYNILIFIHSNPKPTMPLYIHNYNIYINTFVNAPNLALWEGMCCGCGHGNCPTHNGADIKHARCVYMHQTPPTYVLMGGTNQRQQQSKGTDNYSYRTS